MVEENNAQGNLQNDMPDNTPATQPQEQTPATNQERFLAGIREKHPDLDDEGIYGYAIDSYAKAKGRNKEYDESSARLLELLNNDDDAIAFFEAATEVGDIKDAIRGLPEDVLEDILEKKRSGYTLSDEEKENKIREYGEKVSKQRAFRKKIKDNEPKTRQSLEEFATENGLNEQEVEEMILPIIQKLSEGEIDKDLLNMIKNNRSLDEIKKKEYQRGLADGKNEKITEKTLKKEKGSGLPQPSNTKQTEEEKENDNNPFAFITRNK